MPLRSLVRREAVPLRSQKRRVGAHVSAAGGLSNAIKNTLNIDGNCLQIFAGSPRSWDRSLYKESDTNQFVAKSIELDLNPVFIHALYLVNLGTDRPDLLKKSHDSLLSDLKNGDLIHSAGVVVHLGSHQGRGFDGIKHQIIDQINQLLNQTKSTPFLIENSAGQKGKIGTFEEIIDIFTEIKSERLGICLDSAHLFESGMTIADLEKFKLLNKVKFLHLNDSKTGFNSRHDQHANLGDGKMGLESLSQFINLPQLTNLPVILEVPGELGFPDAKQIEIAKGLATS